MACVRAGGFSLQVKSVGTIPIMPVTSMDVSTTSVALNRNCNCRSIGRWRIASQALRIGQTARTRAVSDGGVIGSFAVLCPLVMGSQPCSGRALSARNPPPRPATRPRGARSGRCGDARGVADDGLPVDSRRSCTSVVRRLLRMRKPPPFGSPLSKRN